MLRNRVQFQKGVSEADFDKSYGTEEQYHAALVAWRWPGGFECPDCVGHNHCVVPALCSSHHWLMLRARRPSHYSAG